MDPFASERSSGYTGYGPPRLVERGRLRRRTPSVPAARPILTYRRPRRARGWARRGRLPGLQGPPSAGPCRIPSTSPATSPRWTGDRRLLVWSAHPEEQELLETVGIAGDMPALDGADGWSFSVSNTGGNKIDAFLQRKAGYERHDRPRHRRHDGLRCASSSTNTAPAEGLPKYVIGNRIGKPDGTSSLLGDAVQPARARPESRSTAPSSEPRRVSRTAGTPTGSPSTSPPAGRRPSRRRCRARSPTPRQVVTLDPADVRPTAAALTAASVNSSQMRPELGRICKELTNRSSQVVVRSRSSAGWPGARPRPYCTAARGPTT